MKLWNFVLVVVYNTKFSVLWPNCYVNFIAKCPCFYCHLCFLQTIQIPAVVFIMGNLGSQDRGARVLSSAGSPGKSAYHRDYKLSINC